MLAMLTLTLYFTYTWILWSGCTCCGLEQQPKPQGYTRHVDPHSNISRTHAFCGQVAPVVDASSSQSRTDVLAIMMSAILLLTGLQWLSLKPKATVAVRHASLFIIDAQAAAHGTPAGLPLCTNCGAEHDACERLTHL